MDLATLVGMPMVFALVVGAMLFGGSLMTFIDIPSVLIVLLGSLFATMMAFPMKTLVSIPKAVGNAFKDVTIPLDETTGRLQELAQKVRKEDLLSLENETIEDEFLARAVRLAVDGVPVDTIRQTLEDQMSTLGARHEQAQDLMNYWGGVAPAMGMIGTLVGLVQMLQSLDDPSTIGPSMAVALLTTLYGAMLAYMVFIPWAQKLESRTNNEKANMTLIVEGIDSIVKGENVMITKEKLEAFLSPDEKSGGEAE